mmetsp:Transcript_5619/g.8510  ORF Transcript_5619/g.8510 Transcript_5619/m.8510 type:complete len:95 (-) Transcript_5619:245-529(-)
MMYSRGFKTLPKKIRYFELAKPTLEKGKLASTVVFTEALVDKNWFDPLDYSPCENPKTGEEMGREPQGCPSHVVMEESLVFPELFCHPQRGVVF